jgi:hypothetical protein
MSDSKEAPRLPDVTDEAGESPTWVPLLGLALLCLAALWIAARQSMPHDEKAAANAADAGVAAAAKPAAEAK